MDNYVSMHSEKLHRNDIYGVMTEAIRSSSNRNDKMFSDSAHSNIDWSLTDRNVRLVDCRDWLAKTKDIISSAGIKSVRKDAVLLVDTCYSASHDWFINHSEREIRRYFDDCLAWHRSHYPDSVVISAIIHIDETTPHMHVATVPLVLKDGQLHLTAKNMIGGVTDLHIAQTSFFNTVGESRGMVRGKDAAETKRKHLSVIDYKLTEKQKDYDSLVATMAAKTPVVARTTLFDYDKVVVAKNDLEALQTASALGADAIVVADKAKKAMVSANKRYDIANSDLVDAKAEIKRLKPLDIENKKLVAELAAEKTKTQRYSVALRRLSIILLTAISRLKKLLARHPDAEISSVIDDATRLVVDDAGVSLGAVRSSDGFLDDVNRQSDLIRSYHTEKIKKSFEDELEK